MIGLLFVGGITAAFLVGWLLGEGNLLNLLFWNGGLSKRQLDYMGYTIGDEGYWHNGHFHRDRMLARAYSDLTQDAEPLCDYHRRQSATPGFSDGDYPQPFIGTFDPGCVRCRSYMRLREYVDPGKLDGFATQYGWYDENGRYHPNGSCSQ